jgi:hypothetical protein
MKLNKFKLILLMVFVLASSVSVAKPRVTLSQNPITHYNPNQSPSVVVIQRVNINANNINSIFQNTGIFNQNTALQNTPGFEWPKGSGNHACFTAGLSLGCYIDGSLAQTTASYKGEYSPGYYDASGVYITNPDFKIYSIKAGDNAENNPDYANWFKMVPYGAPFIDVNGNHIYDPGVDQPGIRDAGQVAFISLSDGDLSQHSTGEGFGGGITVPLMHAQVALTIWSYSSPGLENLQFVNWVVVNKGFSPWDRTYMGVVVDPDLGDSDDDYIGCDTTQDMGYCYNGDNEDPDYGVAPPAFGMDYFKSPVNRSSGTPDTLGLTSFIFFTNPGNTPPPCEGDPSGEPLPAYRMLTGVKKDGSPFLDPTQTPPAETKFVYGGDPETNGGWTERKGSVQNCGGLTGTTIALNPPGDRRFIFNSGAEDFTVNPGDTQNIILAQFVAKGSTNLNSATKVKRLSLTAQKIFDANFNVTPLPPPPVVNTVFTPTVPGQLNITLNWGDESESYRYWDSIFHEVVDSNIYKFQGYQVYEIDRFAQSLPDFIEPTTIDNSIKLAAIYDIRDNIGVVIDSLPTGIEVNGNEYYSKLPVVPPYSISAPAGFPNSGIYRSITLNQTQYPQNYGGQTGFVYGQTYKFAVIAYAVSGSDTILLPGFRALFNSITTQTMTVVPVAPPGGTSFTMKNNDTLNTSRRDLGVIPIIKNQDLLKNATYRVLYGSPDTTYRILRLLDGSTEWDTLKRVPGADDKFIRYTDNPSATVLYLKNPTFPEWWQHTSAFDSSRIVDGVYINVQKIRFNFAGGAQYFGNVGVIQDPSQTKTPDSIQTRQPGWSYTPEGRRFVQGSQYVRAAGPWQSQSMSISYPMAGTWNNLGSSIRPDGLRNVRITWTGGDTNAGQAAYRFLDTAANDASFIFQNMKKVPFIVEEIDPTDSTPEPRKLNCAFVESGDVNPITGSFTISADSLGGKTLLYIFNSDYSETPNTFYTTKNLFISATIDIMYVWSPRLLNPGAAPSNGDVLTFYPYNVTRPFVQGNIPMYYEFKTAAPVFGNNQNAKDHNDMEKIRVVPNPYYGYSTLQSGVGNRFVEFRNLPLSCRISIYSLNGDLMATIDKSAGNNTATSSTARWNLQNLENVPVASGIYVALVDAPGIGQKVVKMVVFTAQERINFTN